MTHPISPSSGENLLVDDEDIILLTDEIPQAVNPDMMDVSQLADPSRAQDVQKTTETSTETIDFFDLTDVIEVSDFKTDLPPDFSIPPVDILGYDQKDAQIPDSFDTEPNISVEETASSGRLHTEIDAQYSADDLQRLIDEVVHDSQIPPQDFSAMPAENSEHKNASVLKGDFFSLPQDQIDAAMERVIRKIFPERIQPILDEVITTMVNREIENLRAILLDYLVSGKTVNKNRS